MHEQDISEPNYPFIIYISLNNPHKPLLPIPDSNTARKAVQTHQTAPKTTSDTPKQTPKQELNTTKPKSTGFHQKTNHTLTPCTRNEHNTQKAKHKKKAK
jgi:hypothetical protein